MTRDVALLTLLAGAAILTVAMGIRQTFGLFLSPMSIDLGIGREVFALAIALQNLLWGFAQPFAGMIADRYGTGRVLVAGTLLYAAGLVVMAKVGGSGGLLWGAGVLVGLGLSSTSFAVVLGAVGRAVSHDRRSMALGIASAGGSFGQFAHGTDRPTAHQRGWLALGSAGDGNSRPDDRTARPAARRRSPQQRCRLIPECPCRARPGCRVTRSGRGKRVLVSKSRVLRLWVSGGVHRRSSAGLSQ
jgi:hypothetical protein